MDKKYFLMRKVVFGAFDFWVVLVESQNLELIENYLDELGSDDSLYRVVVCEEFPL